MSERPQDDSIEAHVGSIADRSEREARRLAATLVGRCWSGSSERTVPAALEWLRLWGPGGVAPLPPACSCRVGRCMLCN